MNALPDGRVTACKLFPELTTGQLEPTAESVLQTWQDQHARHARSIFACGLMQICSKCVQLYLHGH